MRIVRPLVLGGFLVLVGGAACGGAEDEGDSRVHVAAGGGAGTTGQAGDGGGAGSIAGGAGSTAGGAGSTAGGAGKGGATAGSAGKGGSSAGSAGSTQGGCLGELDALGVPYTKTAAKGVVDAVHLTGPLNGVLFTNGTKSAPTGDPIACAFVKTLWAAATVYKKHGFVRVGTLGSYCYRCCCAWSKTNDCRGVNDPEPDCGSNGYSNHSWGRAMDVRYLYKADGTLYDVNDAATYVTAGTTDTCGAGIAKQSGKSLELYQLVCAMKSASVFSTILTPNYNADHRNHFHMDIGKSGPASGFIVKSWEDTSLDAGEHPDVCGE